MTETSMGAIISFFVAMLIGIGVINAFGFGDAGSKEEGNQETQTEETAQQQEEKGTVEKEAKKEEEKDKKEKQKEKEEKEEHEVQEVIDVFHSLVKSMLTAALCFVLPLVVLGVAVVLVSGAINEMSERSEERRFPINKKDVGSKSATYLADALEEIENKIKKDRREKDDYTKEKSENAKDIIVKMNGILSAYLADEKTFGMLMYKYEKSFKEIYETIIKVNKLGDGFDDKMYQDIANTIKYPYEEIVEKESVKWAFGELDVENEILKDLKKKSDELED